MTSQEQILAVQDACNRAAYAAALRDDEAARQVVNEALLDAKLKHNRLIELLELLPRSITHPGELSNMKEANYV